MDHLLTKEIPFMIASCPSLFPVLWLTSESSISLDNTIKSINIVNFRLSLRCRGLSLTQDSRLLLWIIRLSVVP